MRGAIAAVVLLGAASAVADDVPISDNARAHFRAGVALLEDPDGAKYEEAYAEFKAAYTDSPSWKILGNLGLSAMKLERDGEAIDAMTKYLMEGGANIDPDERKQFERDLATVQAGAVTLTIEADQAGVLILDSRVPSKGDRISNTYGPFDAKLLIRVRPGRHEITARKAGFKDATWSFQAASGSQQAHSFKLEPESAGAAGAGGGAGAAGAAGAGGEAAAAGTGVAPTMERPVPTSVFIGLAATGAFAVGAGVTGFLAMGKRTKFDDANDGSDPGNAQTLRDSGQQLNLITDVLLGGAVIAGGVTAFLFLSRPETPVQADRGAAWHVAPVVGPSTGGLSLNGRF